MPELRYNARHDSNPSGSAWPKPANDKGKPTKKAILAAAPVEVLRSLNWLGHFGIKQGTFNSYLQRKGWRTEMEVGSKIAPSIRSMKSRRELSLSISTIQFRSENNQLKEVNKLLNKDNNELTKRLVSQRRTSSTDWSRQRASQHAKLKLKKHRAP